MPEEFHPTLIVLLLPVFPVGIDTLAGLHTRACLFL